VTFRPRGYSLLELLLVVAVIAILAALVLPSAQPAVVEQLRSTARIVADDMAYARSLAVANNSAYRITFDITGNRYTLTYSGTNASLATLPATPFATSRDTTTQQITDLDELPHVGPTVRLAKVLSGTSKQIVNYVEFNSLGETTGAESTLIWLTAGGGTDARYITLEVNPVTGIVFVGDCTSSGP
jgi:prepilin-type N-terminal cleavage/methylation domain-containing protein